MSKSKRKHRKKNGFDKSIFHFSHEAPCLHMNDLVRKALRQPPHETRTVVGASGSEPRKIKKIMHHQGEYYMADIVTGTLYDMDGRCLSSEFLRLEK